MLKIQNKYTKRIRVAQIVLFLIQIFLTSTPFMWGQDSKGKNVYYTVLNFISFISTNTSMKGNEAKLSIIGAFFLILLILPIIAAAFNIFDRFYNLKNIASIACSGIALICIVYSVGGAICYGGVFAVLLYLASFFLGVMGVFARYLNIENTASKAPR